MKYKKIWMMTVTCAAVLALSVPAFAEGADVSAVIQDTWTVVFPAMDMILAIAFFVKLGTCYFDYRKHGQMEWTPPVILFVCLIFTLTAPQYIWRILGI